MDTGIASVSDVGSVSEQGGRRRLNGALTSTAWSVDGDLGLAEWVAHGRKLGVIGRAAGWWIGDWLGFGNARFGERYVRASRITGYDVQTLMNMVYVASAYDVSERRDALSWSHHAELAPLEGKERARWLDLAEAKVLSVRCLREEVRRSRRLSEAKDPAGEEPAGELEVPDADDHLECPRCGFRTAVVRASRHES